MKTLIWDLEIRDPVEDKGWEAARNGQCGISCIVIWDSDSGRYHLYDEHRLEEAVDHLNSADLLVGYNTLNFDSNVVFGVTGRFLTVPQYDILSKIWDALAHRKKGYKLDEVATATLNMGKSGNGEFATALYAQKRFGELFDYCLNDVFLTKELYNHIVDLGWIKGADGQELHIEQSGYKEYA